MVQADKANVVSSTRLLVSAASVEEMAPSKKRMKAPNKHKVSQHLKNFCGQTSIHGLGYLYMESASLHAKVFWVVA